MLPRRNVAERGDERAPHGVAFDDHVGGIGHISGNGPGIVVRDPGDPVVG